MFIIIIIALTGVWNVKFIEPLHEDLIESVWTLQTHYPQLLSPTTPEESHDEIECIEKYQFSIVHLVFCTRLIT